MFDSRSTESAKAILLSHPVLRLLFEHKPSADPAFVAVHSAMHDALEPTASTEQRVDAALRVSDFAKALRIDAQYDTNSRHAASAWAKLAAGFGSAQGARAHALLLLDDTRLKLEQVSPLNGGLPSLARLNQSESGTTRAADALGCSNPPLAPARVMKQWLEGAQLALSDTLNGDTPWYVAERAAALDCLVNWLVLRPVGTPTAAFLASRQDAINGWALVAWRKLVGVHAENRDAGAADTLWRLVRAQLQAECRALTWSDPGVSNVVNEEKAHLGSTHLVVRGQITPTQDKYDREYLESFAVLTRPLPVATMPGRQALAQCLATLVSEFPWAHEVIRAIFAQLAASTQYGAARAGLRPTLLVGPPGCGKTRLASRLATLLSQTHTIINLAGMHDARLLKGTARGWASARPSRVVEFVAQSAVANPYFVLDELDKLATDRDGAAAYALLDLLEPINAARYHDTYLLTECDLSRCQYIATANSLSGLTMPLLSRFQILSFPPPGPEHLAVIVRSVIQDLEREWELAPGTIDLQGHRLATLVGLPPRAIRHAVLDQLGEQALEGLTLH